MCPVVAAIRTHPVFGDLAGNRQAALAALTAAADAGATILVLPELCISGYCFESDAEADAACETIPGPSTAQWSSFAQERQVVIVGGLAELDADGQRRNSAVVIDPTGIVGVYRKIHLWGRETLYFVPGDKPPLVAATSLGRIGVGVCYDLWFPELVRALADGGAELLVFPSNLTDDPPIVLSDHIYVAVARAAAHLNRVPLVVADRCGTERGANWTGAAVVIDASGTTRALAPNGDAPAVVTADLPTLSRRETSWGPHNDIVTDRRAALVNPS